jgi:predicted RNA-binding Zn ribbon-like protein
MASAPDVSPHPHDFDFSGGDLCLDFVNTVSDRGTGQGEHLAAWPDLTAWGEQAGLLAPADAVRLRGAARRRDAQLARDFHRALALREGLYRVFSTIAAGRAPEARELRELNERIGMTLRHARLVARDGQLAWSWAWTESRSPFDRVVWPVVKSAADRLASPGAADIRECASSTCTWLFVDQSRTKRRRWCSMQTCGNRAKARRFYERRHQTAP